MTSVGSLPVPRNPCHDAFTTKIALIVAKDGTVTGTGQAVATEPPTCAIQPRTIPPVASVVLSIQGTYANDAFTIRLTPLTIAPSPGLDGGFFANWVGAAGSPTQVLPAKDGKVQATTTVTDASRDRAGTSVNTWDLKMGCDPDALARAEREIDTGNSFAAASAKELKQAANEFTTFEADYAKEAGEVGAEKASLLQAVKGLDAVLEAGPLEAYADLEQATEVAGIYGAVIVTAEESYTKYYPAFKERSNLAKQADADLKRAEDWWARGKADLKVALAQGPCLGTTEDQLNKALADQERIDKEREKIESWENNGNLYVSPIDGELLQEDAALKLAGSILDGTVHEPRSRNTGTQPTPESERAEIKAVVQHLQDAIRQLDHSIELHQKVVGQIDKFQSATATLLQGLPHQ